MKNRDRFRGCLLGGAAGDALGYAVEFLRRDQILRRYGTQGITVYACKDGVAQISDDTQMTLFTAVGLLYANHMQQQGTPITYTQGIYEAYRDWLYTQMTVNGYQPQLWLGQVRTLYTCRAPGNTCLSAMIHLGNADRVARNAVLDEPINSSKGCGGVMRVAPIGLYFLDTGLSADAVDRLGAEAAAITHGHPLGIMPSAALVHLVRDLASQETPSMRESVARMRQAMCVQYREEKKLPDFLQLVDWAVELTESNMTDADAIAKLGEGWVAEETLAIALYCVLKYPQDFDRAMIAAVNHDGDSDSTGAVAGNLLGAALGEQGIPVKYIEHLELYDLICRVADDLFDNRYRMTP